jgi:phage portal protein BeeE
MQNPLRRFKAWLDAEDIEAKFSPADPAVNWTRVETLIHGPAAWQQPGNADGNSAAFACLQVLASSAIEPPLRVYRDLGDGQPERLDEHPAQALLDDPNPALTPEELYFWLWWALHLDGNSYLLKRRAGGTAFDAVRGNVVELWPISPT